MFWITDHVLDSYSIFYPSAWEDDVRNEVSLAVEIEPEVARGLVGRLKTPDGPPSQYRLHRERTGIFVMDGTSVITFLRFYALRQHQEATRLFPVGVVHPPTARVGWNHPAAMVGAVA